MTPANSRPAGGPVRAYLALGANQGTPILNLKRAARMLDAESGVEVAARSSIYETRPVGPPGQPDFFNAVLAVDTVLSPRQLLRRCQAIETALGRRQSEGGAARLQWAPRPIDIDILLYDERVLIDGHLSIPHPRIAERDFVVVPLREVAPLVTYPGGRPVQLSPTGHRTIVRRLEGGWD